MEISQELIEKIIAVLENNAAETLREEIEALHPADIAEIFNQIPEEFETDFLAILSSELHADVIAELDEDERQKLLDKLSPAEIADKVLSNMESDDAADLLGELSDEKKAEVIRVLEQDNSSNDIIDLLNYPENTAGALMATELVKANINWTVHECIIELRKQAEEVEKVHTVYAVDDQEKLIGRISLKHLIIQSPQTKVQEIVEKELIVVQANAEDYEVVNKMEKYDLVVIPVVDEQNRLIGRITIDDVVDLMKEEAEKDYQMASGISENVEISDDIFTLTKARLPWLLVGLAGGLAGAKVIGAFDVIEKSPALAAFIPLIAAMGGNVGVQSSAIVVQSIANNSFKGSMTSKLIKELGVGLLNAFMCSAILLAFNLIFADSFELSLSVSLSLFSVIIFAAVFGTWVPLILHKYKVDPALATGPFITTSNDIIGLMLYFSICQLFI